MSFSVLLIFRKKNPSFFSIENVFERIISGSQIPEKFKKLVLPKFGISFWNLMFLIRKRRRHSGIFHVTGDVHYSVIVLPRRRTILTIHDCVFLEQNKGIKKWMLKKILLDIPVWMVDHVTTISEKSKEDIIRYTGCTSEKISVIHNPIPPTISYTRRVFNVDLPTLLFIGITPNKNLERVAEALSDISCVLHVVGRLSLWQTNTLKSFGVRYKQENNLTDKEMAIVYSDCDIVLFPSLYEGFGLPIIEGFKAGRVVLTSDRSPMKEVGGGAACLVDPEDVESIRQGVLRLIRDANYRENLIQRGFQRVREYEPEVIAQQYYQLYQKVYEKSCAG